MRASGFLKLISIVCCAGALTSCVSLRSESGFTSLFDGKTLNGWKLVGAKGGGYTVANGVIACAKGGGGNLFTEREYSDFILRFEFKLEDGSNNGVGIRAPLEGDAAYVGMEIQILDDNAPKWANLRPNQYHGSIYDVIPARRGALNRPGEWNAEEILCVGRRVKVVLNGQTILDANLNDVTDPVVLAAHPGLLRERGRVGFLGHDDYVEFRNIRIKELTRFPRNNVAPQGFTALFDGVSLTGWKGLVADPPKRSKMSRSELATAQANADELMRKNWEVKDGMLVYRGKEFDNLCTTRDYRDFELVADWKMEEKSDSGIYLRGSPQVQIWGDLVGSGGLFNNQKNPSRPTKRADYFTGEWNRFRILMQGDKVTVFLNNELIVHNVTLENYWERDKPLYEKGSIELQNHGNTLYFRNIYLKELP